MHADNCPRFPQGLNLRNLAIMVDMTRTDNPLHPAQLPHHSFVDELYNTPTQQPVMIHDEVIPTKKLDRPRSSTSQACDSVTCITSARFPFLFPHHSIAPAFMDGGGTLKQDFRAFPHSRGPPRIFGAGALRLGHSTHRKIAHDTAGAAVKTAHTRPACPNEPAARHHSGSLARPQKERFGAKGAEAERCWGEESVKGHLCPAFPGKTESWTGLLAACSLHDSAVWDIG